MQPITKTILVTGATGKIGRVVVDYLHQRQTPNLILIDKETRGLPGITQHDLSVWTDELVHIFKGGSTEKGAEVVLHFAADPNHYVTWPNVIDPNIQALLNTYEAAARAGVKRVVFASSNHVMGGYKDHPELWPIREDMPIMPGTFYEDDTDSIPYATSKVFGEQVGQFYACTRGLEVIAVRIGWAFGPDPDAPPGATPPPGSEKWGQDMIITEEDLCHLMERCIEAPLAERFVVVNGMSAHTPAIWDLTRVKQVLGYQSQIPVSLK
jgi:NAD+ dependent glucose-6-phosphate dehydrogenase